MGEANIKVKCCRKPLQTNAMHFRDIGMRMDGTNAVEVLDDFNVLPLKEGAHKNLIFSWNV